MGQLVATAAIAWNAPQKIVANAITIRGLKRSASMPPGICINA